MAMKSTIVRICPGYPHHFTQRGNNRATVFFDDEDRQTYLKLLSGRGKTQ
jgi:putative transposase